MSQSWYRPARQASRGPLQFLQTKAGRVWPTLKHTARVRFSDFLQIIHNQLVEALRSEPGGRGFGCRWCHWNFSLMYTFWPLYGPGLDSAFQQGWVPGIFPGGKGDRCVGLTTLPPSCTQCLEIWEPQTFGTLGACPDLYRDCFTCYFPSFGGDNLQVEKASLNYRRSTRY